MKHLKKTGYVIGIVLITVILIFFSVVIFILGFKIFGNISKIQIAEDTIYNVSGSLGIAVVAFALSAYVHKKNDTICFQKKEPFHIGKALGYGMLTVCLGSWIYYPISTWIFSRIAQASQTISPQISSFEMIVFGLVISPITEELLFRQGIYCLLRRKLKKITAILITTFGFTILHGFQIHGFFTCLIVGFLLIMIYENTGNIWYSIVAHGLCNLNSAILNVLERRGVTLFGKPIQYEVNGFNTHHIMFLLIGVIFCGCYLGNWFAKRKISASGKRGSDVSDFGG